MAAYNTISETQVGVEIVAAIAARGYRIQPLSCYPSMWKPQRCIMALHSSGNFRYGWLDIWVDRSKIYIVECTPRLCSGEA